MTQPVGVGNIKTAQLADIGILLFNSEIIKFVMWGPPNSIEIQGYCLVREVKGQLAYGVCVPRILNQLSAPKHSFSRVAS
jgi:hypothetical protein